MTLKSIVGEVEQHARDTKLHPDFASGLRLIAARVESAFKRLLVEGREEDQAFYEHIVNGALHPREIVRQAAEEARAAQDAADQRTQESDLMQIAEPTKDAGSVDKTDAGADKAT